METTFTKDALRLEAYLGCEVMGVGASQTNKKPANQLLCDLAYLRVWDGYEPADKIHEEFADANAPHPLLVAGSQATYMTAVPIIYEDKGYILEAIPGREQQQN
jgi:hypothetical protein